MSASRGGLAALLVAIAVASPAAVASFHANLQVHVLEPGLPPRVDSYSLGSGGSDWAGRFWVEDIAGPLPADRDPLLAVAFETLEPGGARQSRFALLRSDAVQKRFFVHQIESVGPPDSEIHYLEILFLGGAFWLEVYEGLNPDRPAFALEKHRYFWNGATFVFVETIPGAALPADPEDLSRPLPSEMVIGLGPGVPFDVTTNSTIFGASRVLIVESVAPSPNDLTVEADPKGGDYAATVPVVLSSSSPSATIRYTLDGTDPIAAGAGTRIYQPGRPVHVLPCDPVTGACAAATAVSLQATEAGKNPSPIVRETYRVAQGKNADTDGDGLLDLWEANRCITDCREPGCCGDPLPVGCTPREHCFDPLVSDADADCDRDGASDFDELRLGSSPTCGDSEPAPGADMRQVQISGVVMRPDAVAVADSAVESISPRGSDLHSAPNPTTQFDGSFADARTRGESDVILAVADQAEPQVVLQRFVPRLIWAGSLPPTTFDDDDFTGADEWFALYTAALQYSVSVAAGGTDVDARASAVLQLLEHTVETMLPELVLDYTGIPVGDVNRPPLGDFPGLGDLDLNANGTFERIEITLGRIGSGLTGTQARVLLRGTDLSLLGQSLQQAAEDPLKVTLADWVSFAEDVVRAVPEVATFFGTTDDVLTGILDDPESLDPDIASAIDALPLGAGADLASLAIGRGDRLGRIAASIDPGTRPQATILPDLPTVVAAAKAAATTTAAIYGRVVARGETAIYESGDAFASGGEYRAIVVDLVDARAGDLSALADLAAGADEVARAVEEARLLAASGRTSAVQHLRAGIGVLAAALDAANGGVSALGNLDARMAGLVYRLDRAAGDPAALAALEAMAPEFLQPDTAPPVVAAAPPGPLFTGSVLVSLVSDEPATIHYTLDGTDPVPGGAGTSSGSNEIAGILIAADTTLSWLGVDAPWGNTSAVFRITYRQDADADGVADVGDNCPGAHNPGQEDLDGDLMGDACDSNDDNDPLDDDLDCRPLDPALWSAPGEASVTIRFVDGDSLGWTSLAGVAGPGTLYDLARGPLSDLHGGQPPGDEFDGASCLANDSAALAFDDPSAPGLRDGFYYLVRGDNACGTGIYGRGSAGGERVITACP